MNERRGSKTYQVWHDTGWPQSRLNEKLGGWPAPSFPGDQYVHVANVQANGLKEAVELTTDKGGILDDTRPWQPWDKNNQGVEALTRMPRDTVPGDVIVDPQGQRYRVEDGHFEEITRETSSEFEQRLEQAAACASDQTRSQGMGR